MALKHFSSFLYGFEVTTENRSMDFVRSIAGPPLQATLEIGFYSLSELCQEIKDQMEAVDAINTYSVTADRSIAGGEQNRVTISTSGTYLDLLFGTGPRAASTVAPLIGFNSTDRTGSTSYTGNNSAGIILLPNWYGFNYNSPSIFKKNFGSLNISASGLKEAIVYSTQEFWNVTFKYIPEAIAETEWSDFMTWAIAQKSIEFTPDLRFPNVFFVGTLESTSQDGKGLAFRLSEMLPDLPNFYETGNMMFRRKVI